MNELDHRFERAREETESLEAPSTLVHGILEGVRARASQPPQVFSALDPLAEGRSFSWSWLVAMLVVVLLGAAVWLADGRAGPGPEQVLAVEPVAHPVTPGRPRVGVVPLVSAQVVAPREAVPLSAAGVAPSAARLESPRTVTPVSPSGPTRPAQTASSLGGGGVPGEVPVQVTTAFGVDGLVGEQAYPFVATTIDGRRVSLNDLRGKIVMLDTLSVHCGFCMTELPALQRIAKATGVVVIVIADDEENDVVDFGRRIPYPFLLVADPEKRLLAHFPQSGTPTHIVIDRDGLFFRQTITSGVGQPEDIEAAIRFAQSPHHATQVIRAPVIDGPCVIEGDVVREVTLAPVPRASVQVSPESVGKERSFGAYTRKATTDAQGHFKVNDVVCGEFSGQVWAQGLTSLDFKLRSSANGIKANALKMQGLGAVSGFVVDAHGAPVAGATVSQCKDWRSAEPIQTVTDARGWFGLSGLDLGETSLIATLAGAHGGTPVTVRIEERRTAKTRIEAHSATITGTVKDVKSQAPLTVQASSVGSTSCRQLSPTIPVQRDGTFTMTVNPGPYRLVLHETGRAWVSEPHLTQALEGTVVTVELTDDRP